MKAMKVELIFGKRTAERFVKETLANLKPRYKPKQVFIHEVEYFEK